MQLNLKAELFEAIIESSDDAIISKTLDGRVTSWNPGATAIFGYSAEEMLGNNIAVLFPPGREDEEASILEQIQRGDKVDHFETVRLRKDGTLVDLSVTISPIRDDQGQIIGASKIARDISQRKLYEQQLHASKEQIADLYNHAPCGYHSLDSEGVIININDTELEWLGREREEVIGKLNFADCLTPSSKELFYSRFKEFMARGRAQNFEYEIVGKNGEPRFISLSATAIRDSQGNYLKSRSILYDITELKQTQIALQQLTIEQQAMLHTDLIGIVKLRNRRAVWLNPEMERLFGYSTGELVGTSSRILYPDDASYEAMYEAAYPILSSGGVYRTEIQFVTKAGKQIWVDLSGEQLSYSNSDSIWLMKDITEQKLQHQHIESIAFHDSLTGLPNRMLVVNRLQHALAQAERLGQSVAISYLDLDGFKHVNDTFGHAVGDELLLELANRMQASVRITDTVGRLGGDEFVLLLTFINSFDEFQIILQRVIDAINLPVSLSISTHVTVGASIGVTVFPSDSSDPNILLQHADQAMYQAKKSGRNRICIYGERDHQ